MSVCPKCAAEWQPGAARCTQGCDLADVLRARSVVADYLAGEPVAYADAASADLTLKKAGMDVLGTMLPEANPRTAECAAFAERVDEFADASPATRTASMPVFARHVESCARCVKLWHSVASPADAQRVAALWSRLSGPEVAPTVPEAAAWVETRSAETPIAQTHVWRLAKSIKIQYHIDGSLEQVAGTPSVEMIGTGRVLAGKTDAKAKTWRLVHEPSGLEVRVTASFVEYRFAVHVQLWRRDVPAAADSLEAAGNASGPVYRGRLRAEGHDLTLRPDTWTLRVAAKDVTLELVLELAEAP